MKLTKYEHACLIVDNDQTKLIIDPGCFTTLPEDLSGIGCLVITEEHVDHFDLKNVRKIIAQNSNLTILTTAVVATMLVKESINAEAISGHQTMKVGGFSLHFYETPHAPIYQNSPCQSLAVKVDDYLYYPSDTYRTIEDTVEILALPTSGTWHKIEEAIDLANAINSRKILATHNGLYNDNGQAVANKFITTNISDETREFIYLKPGTSLP